MTRPRHARFGSGAALFTLCAGFLAAPLSAQDRVAPPAPSLEWVPADAATYSVALRTREQLQAILQSKAWARLWSMPAVKMAWKMVTDEWSNPSGKLAQVKAWYDDPEHAELVHFLGELFEEEVFSFNAKSSAPGHLFEKLQAANQFAPLAAMLKDGPAAASQMGPMRIKIILQTLAANEQDIKVPDTVVGFKLSRTKPEQIEKWLASAEQTLGQLAPPLAERFKKIKIHGADVHTLTLDGEMVPWDMVHLGAFEDQPGQYDKLIKRLKETKLTIAVTVRGGYLLVGIGPATAGLEACSNRLANRLSSRAELEPLAKFAGRKFTSISYLSKEYARALSPANVEASLGDQLAGLLKDSGLPAEEQATIAADLKSLTAGLKIPPPPQPGADLSFSFIGKRGMEDFNYNWSTGARHNPKPLTLLTHVGSTPLAFALGRVNGTMDDYKLLVRIIKLGGKEFDEFALPKLPENVKQPYEAFMADARPLLERLDKATGTLLLPSLDGQIGIVFDAKLTSRRWVKQMPPANYLLPFPEIGLVFGVKDAAKFRKAFQEYRAVLNGLIQAAAKLAPGKVPPIMVPEPKTARQKVGTIYWYPLPPQIGLDQRIAPSAGLSSKVAVFTMSPLTSQRLLTPTVLKASAGPLAQAPRSRLGVGYFDWAGVVDAATPWVEFGLTMSKQDDEVKGQVKTGLEILKVLRSYTSVTYIDNGITITHGETIIRDLDR